MLYVQCNGNSYTEDHEFDSNGNIVTLTEEKQYSTELETYVNTINRNYLSQMELQQIREEA